jgi:hypothetical protein
VCGAINCAHDVELNKTSGLDPSKDTPVEILHTFLLGVVKYVWHSMTSSWKDGSSEEKLFAIRLASTDTDGLDVPDIKAAYMMQYKGGLIGKHFKILSQTAIFHLHGLVSPPVFNLMKAVATLGAMLWIAEIDNMKQYLVSATIVITKINALTYMISAG